MMKAVRKWKTEELEDAKIIQYSSIGISTESTKKDDKKISEKNRKYQKKKEFYGDILRFEES